MYNPLIMTPETAMSSEPQPQGMSEVSRLVGVFFEPKKVFADIAARPRWIVPLLLMIVSAIGITTLYSQKGVMRIAAEQQMDAIVAAAWPRATQAPQRELPAELPLGA